MAESSSKSNPRTAMATPSFVLKEGDPSTWTPPATGYVNIGADTSGRLVVQTPGGTITPLGTVGVGRNAQTASGSTFAVAPTAALWTEIVSVAGSGRTLTGLLGTIGVADGWILRLVINLGVISGIDLQIFSGAIELADFLTDGSQANLFAEFHYDAGSTAWVLDVFQINAHA